VSSKDRNRALQKISQGHTLKEAAVLCGVSYMTLNSERNRDSAFDEQVKNAIVVGRIRAKATAKGTLLRAIGKEWRAAVTYLERMYPEEWSKHRHVTHDGEVEVSHTTDVGGVVRELLNDEQYIEFCRQQAVSADTGALCTGGQPGPVEDGPPSCPDGSEAG
jgi:hypothetical protein